MVRARRGAVARDTHRVLVLQLALPVGLAVLELALPPAGVTRLVVLDLAQPARELVALVGQPPAGGPVGLALVLELGRERGQLLDLRLLELEVVLGLLVQVDELRQVGLGLRVFLWAPAGEEDGRARASEPGGGRTEGTRNQAADSRP